MSRNVRPSDPAAPPSGVASAFPAQAVVLRRITARETVPLRHAVLWPDKPASYVLLPADDAGHHFGAFLPDAEPDSRTAEPVAVISLFCERVPVPSLAPAPIGEDGAALRSDMDIAGTSAGCEVQAARFRKFACAHAYQGRGVGSALLRRLMAVARDELGCQVIWCDARSETAGWYERRGLRKFGDTFFKGEVEYVRMQAPL